MALLAWLAFPLLALAICLGIGLLAERLANAELPPALLPALGYAAAIVVLGPLCALGSSGAVTAIALVALALVGYGARSAWIWAVRGMWPRLRPGAGAFAAAVVYLLYIAPVALSGEVSFLGYNLLNDTAIHLALVDWIGQHGSHFIHQPPSSYGAAINEYVGSRYPLGSHELLAALKPLVGLDPARIYQPFLAFSAAVAAGAVHALARRMGMPARTAALAAVAALGSQLVFSFALQGGIKELSFIACLAAAAALAAYGEVRLMALPAVALYAIYGLSALPWIAPLALAALLLVRPSRRHVVQSVLLFLVAVAVLVPDSIDFWRHGHDVLASGSELGPLLHPLDPLQAAGVWLNGDYRITPQHSWLTYILAAAVLVLAAAGTLAAWRARRPALLLLVVPALVAWAATAPVSSPYIDAKLLAILSPALLLAAAAGLATVRRPRVAGVVAAVLGVAIAGSDALAYRMALVAPIDRLDELGDIDKRFAGRGPILVNEYEEYVKHYMRRSRGSDPYEGWNAGRAQLRNPKLRVAAHAYDLDQLRVGFVERYALIALRRSPAESAPPSNYRRVWSGRFYEVWQRVGPAPRAHTPLGRPPFAPAQPLPCPVVRDRGAAGSPVALLRARPVIVRIDRVALPPGWYRDPAYRAALVTNKGGRVAVPFVASGPLHVWLRGRAFRPVHVLIDGQAVGSVRELNGPNQWMDVGRVQLAAGTHRLELVRPTRSLRPGDAQRDVLGPAALVPAGAARLTSSPRCGQSADWLDARP